MACRMRCSSKATWQAGRKFLAQWLPAHDRHEFPARPSLVARGADRRSTPATSTAHSRSTNSRSSRQAGPIRRSISTPTAPRCCGGCRWPARLVWNRIGAMSRPTATNISRRPARISPMSITRWPRQQWAARRWTHDWPNWKRAKPDGKLAPGSSAIDICRGVRAFAAGDNDNAIHLLEPVMSEVRAHRWQPRPARIVGRHPDRRLSARRTRRQGQQAHLHPT